MSEIDETRGSDRTAWIVFIALMAATSLSLIWIVHECFTPFYDASLYVLTAKSLVNGEGYRLFGENFGLRAPGFAAMLAPIIAIFGTDFLAMNIFVALTGVIALGLIYWYARPTVGVWIAGAFCVLLWLNPCFRRYSITIMSDLPGLAAIFGALLLERRARRSDSRRRIVALGVILGVAVNLRAVNQFLVVAVVVAWLADRASGWTVRRRVKRVVLLAVVVGALAAPWEVWKRLHPPPVPSNTAGTYSFLTGVFHEDPSDPRSRLWTASELRDRAIERTGQELTSLGSRLRHQGDDPFAWVIGLALLAACAFVAIRKRDVGCIFAFLNAVILLLFNDWSHRLMLPIFIIAAIAALGLVARWLKARGAVFSIVASVVVVALGVFDRDLNLKSEWLETRHAANVDISRFVEENFPPDVNVAACMGHTIAAYFERPCYFVEKVMGREQVLGTVRFLEEKNVKLFVHSGRSQNHFWMRNLANVLRGSKGIRSADEVLLLELPPARPPFEVPKEKKTIAAALELAVDGDTIRVAPGTYRENVDLENEGISLMASGGPTRTFLVGTGDRPVVRIIGEGRETSTLRGFTIVGSGVRSAAPAVVCVDSSPVIEHNVITNGRGVAAGAIVCGSSGSPTIRRNRFVGCRGARAGAVACEPGVEPDVFANEFVGNQGEAGALWLERGRVRANTFRTNVGKRAGAVRLAGGLVVGNLIAGNRTTDGGGGITAPLDRAMALSIENNTIVDNDAGDKIGAVAGFYGAASSFRNNILRNRGGVELVAGRVSAITSNVRGGAPGRGNLDADPKFVDAARGDYHIRHDSPCRDAGSSGANPFDEIDFQSRDDGRPDIGADEFVSSIYVQGGKREGSDVRVTVTGEPGLAAAWAYSVAGRVRVPPLETALGSLYLHWPLALGGAGILDESGALTTTFTLPRGGVPVYALQGVVGRRLTNVWLLAVE